MKPKFFQSAVVYRWEDRMFIVPYLRNVDGIRTQMDLVVEASPANSQAIGDQLLWALARCIDDVSENDIDRIKERPVLRATGVKSWRSFHRKAESISVYRNIDTGVTELVPTRRIGAGTEDINEMTIKTSKAGSELGSLVLKAMSQSE